MPEHAGFAAEDPGTEEDPEKVEDQFGEEGPDES